MVSLFVSPVSVAGVRLSVAKVHLLWYINNREISIDGNNRRRWRRCTKNTIWNTMMTPVRRSW